MFDDRVESPGRRSCAAWSVWFSAAMQMFFLGLLVLAPLVYTPALPGRTAAVFLIEPSPPSSPPVVASHHTVSTLIRPGEIRAPAVIPQNLRQLEVAAEPHFANAVPPIPGNIPGITPTGSLNKSFENALLPPHPTEPRGPFRVGGNVEQAKLVHEVEPLYPRIAKTARIQGTIVLRAIIARDGNIRELEYVSGPLILLPAAISAVRQWRYAPTLLNGQPVEVDTTIDVVFTLGND